MIQKEMPTPVNLEGDEPCQILSVRFGRHPADANVTVHVPKLDAQVNFALSPGVYMNKDFLENYLHYVCVVTTKRRLHPDEAANAAVAAAEFIGFGHVMPAVEGENQTAELCVLYSDEFPRNLEMETKGTFTAGLLVVIQAAPEAFQQSVHIMKMSGLAAMAGGKLHEQPAQNDDASEVSKNIVGRRLSDAMPPNNSKH